MNGIRWFIGLWLAFSLPALGAGKGDLYAQNGAQSQADAVQISLWTVHATNKTQGVDKGLKRIAKHLHNLNYTGFALLGKKKAELPVQGKRRFHIVGEKTVEVTVLERGEKRARVRVQVHSPKGKLLDTTVSIRRNGFFMVAGPKYKKGVLVLPIFARY